MKHHRKRWVRRNRHKHPYLVDIYKSCGWDIAYFSEWHFPVSIHTFKVKPKQVVFIDGFTSMSLATLKYFLEKDRNCVDI